MKLGYTREELLATMRATGEPEMIAQADRLASVKGWRPEQLFRLLSEKLGRECKIDGREVK